MDIRTLNVILQTTSSNLTLFTRNGEQGNVWRKGQMDYQSTLSYKILFEGIGKYCVRTSKSNQYDGVRCF